MNATQGTLYKSYYKLLFNQSPGNIHSFGVGG